jgi:hypothetical protein
MRIVFLISCCLIATWSFAQTRTAPRATSTARGAMVLTVTDRRGAFLSGIDVEVTGSTDREGITDPRGTVRFANLPAGTYRARFSGDRVVTFEREIVVRSAVTTEVDVALSPAPQSAAAASSNDSVRAGAPAPAPNAPAPAPLPAVGPPAQPRTVAIPEFVERNFIGRQPRRESPLSCSGNARTTLLQLNEPLPERLYQGAESMYYVVAGEGTIRINGRDSTLAAGTFAVVPRGASHAVMRRGRNPIILVHVLSGEPCPAGL